MFLAGWWRRGLCGYACIAVQMLIAASAGSRCVVDDDGSEIKISVYIDCNQEPKVRELEGTAMLRTNRQLRKRFKELPKTFSLPISVERADLDLESNVYVYVTNIQRKDIDDFIANFKKQEAERLENDRLKMQLEAAKECKASACSTNKTSVACSTNKTSGVDKEIAGSSLVVADKEKVGIGGAVAQRLPSVGCGSRGARALPTDTPIIQDRHNKSTNGCYQTKSDVSQTVPVIRMKSAMCCVSNSVSPLKRECDMSCTLRDLRAESQKRDQQEIFSNVVSNRIREAEILQEMGEKQNKAKDDQAEKNNEKVAEKAISNLF